MYLFYTDLSKTQQSSEYVCHKTSRIYDMQNDADSITTLGI